MCGQCGGDRAEHPFGETAAPAGAHHHQAHLLAQVHQHASRVAGLQRAGDLHAAVGHPGHRLVQHSLRALTDGGVVEGGVATVQGGCSEGGDGVGAHQVQPPADLQRLCHSPFQRVQAGR